MRAALGGQSEVTLTPALCWLQGGGAEQGRAERSPSSERGCPAASAKAPPALGPSPGTCVQL